MRLDDLYLVDIIESAEKLTSMIGGIGEEAFKDDEMLSSAVQYLLIVMGEACGKLQPPTLAGMPSVAVAQVRAFRNRLVHGYFAVDLEIVWLVATEHVPLLANAAELALTSLFPDTFRKLQQRRGHDETSP